MNFPSSQENENIEPKKSGLENSNELLENMIQKVENKTLKFSALEKFFNQLLKNNVNISKKIHQKYKRLYKQELQASFDSQLQEIIENFELEKVQKFFELKKLGEKEGIKIDKQKLHFLVKKINEQLNNVGEKLLNGDFEYLELITKFRIFVNSLEGISITLTKSFLDNIKKNWETELDDQLDQLMITNSKHSYLKLKKIVELARECKLGKDQIYMQNETTKIVIGIDIEKHEKILEEKLPQTKGTYGDWYPYKKPSFSSEK